MQSRAHRAVMVSYTSAHSWDFIFVWRSGSATAPPLVRGSFNLRVTGDRPLPRCSLFAFRWTFQVLNSTVTKMTQLGNKYHSRGLLQRLSSYFHEYARAPSPCISAAIRTGILAHPPSPRRFQLTPNYGKYVQGPHSYRLKLEL